MSNNIKLNVYDNLRKPQISTVPNRRTIEEWFELIKSSDLSTDIKLARLAGKYTPEYDKIKAEMPCVTYNFLFKKHKNDDNIDRATGLMYIDVDPEKGKAFDFDINKLDTSKVFAYHKSFGGNGYVIIVQVKGLKTDLTNFNSTYKSIMNDLGLAKYFDPQAVKATQFNVLSYDPNLFYNPNSFVFNAIEVVNEEFNSNTNDVNFVSPSGVIKKKKIYSAEGDTKNEKDLRFNNSDEFAILGKYAFDWNGYDDYVECFLPFRKIAEGKRNSTLLSYCNNLVWLNPQLTPAGAITIMKNVNNNACAVALPDAQVVSIVNSIFKYKEAGTLKPLKSKKKRKILFAKNSGLSHQEKFAKCRELLGDKKQNESLEKIDKIIRDWDFEAYGKITIRSIIKYGKMSNKTLTKYWSEFKDIVEDLNLANNQIKTKSKPVIMREAQSNSNDIKAVKWTFKVKQPELLDVTFDPSAGFYIANYSVYHNTLANIDMGIVSALDILIYVALQKGKKGNMGFEEGDYSFDFNLHPSLNTVEFKSIKKNGVELLIAQSEKSDLKPLETISATEPIQLSDVKFDASAGLYIANSSYYKKAVAIIDLTDLINLELQLLNALKNGKDGHISIPVDDYVFNFKLHPAMNTVEFKSINEGDEVLLKAA